MPILNVRQREKNSTISMGDLFMYCIQSNNNVSDSMSIAASAQL